MMSRATIYRIIGIGFLAFAVLSVYRGEYALGRSGGSVVTLAHDPGAFWRGIVIQVAAGCALLYLSRSARSRASSDNAVQDANPGSLSLPNYDSVFCGKVMKAAACVCAGLILADLLVLLFVHPSEDRCPGWIFHPHQRSAISLWLFAGMFTMMPALWMVYVATRWDDYFARKMRDSLLQGPPQQLLMDMNSLTLLVAGGWCLFCAIPLFLMLGSCTPLIDALNAWRS